jgi:hypothetical protein
MHRKPIFFLPGPSVTGRARRSPSPQFFFRRIFRLRRERQLSASPAAGRVGMATRSRRRDRRQPRLPALLDARPETAAATQRMVHPLRPGVAQRVDLLRGPAETLRLISRDDVTHDQGSRIQPALAVDEHIRRSVIVDRLTTTTALTRQPAALPIRPNHPPPRRGVQQRVRSSPRPLPDHERGPFLWLREPPSCPCRHLYSE